MAADTPAKRLSAMNPMGPWRGPAVITAAAPVTAGERRTLLFLYSGITGAAPPATTAPFRTLMGVGV